MGREEEVPAYSAQLFCSVQRRDDAHFVVIFAIAYLACICWSKVGVCLEYQAVLGLEFRKLFISFA